VFLPSVGHAFEAIDTAVVGAGCVLALRDKRRLQNAMRRPSVVGKWLGFAKHGVERGRARNRDLSRIVMVILKAKHAKASGAQF
jgi:hypothetical protein